jgi:hypothetical protein
MIVELYTRCWNDGEMLPFFFLHYDDIVSRYVVFDDGSTDNSIDLLRSHGKVDLRPMPPRSDPDSRVASGTQVMETCWRESRDRADWVIVTDIDEHLRHRALLRYLGRCKAAGVTLVPVLGFDMVGDGFPPTNVRLTDAITRGRPEAAQSKPCVFDPSAIEETRFTIGRHRASPQGRVVLPPRDEVLALHYKYVGFERLAARHRDYRARQRSKDLRNRWGSQYDWSAEELRKKWKEVEAGAVDVSAASYRPWADHKESKWWLEYPRVSWIRWKLAGFSA